MIVKQVLNGSSAAAISGKFEPKPKCLCADAICYREISKLLTSPVGVRVQFMATFSTPPLRTT